MKISKLTLLLLAVNLSLLTGVVMKSSGIRPVRFSAPELTFVTNSLVFEVTETTAGAASSVHRGMQMPSSKNSGRCRRLKRMF